ncbi:MAG: M48 family metalloprotease [Roseofilum sp. SBFL]|uniref:M48 family metallopeptidase n=1 Tax=unclassified Roseofilum TaxID=2620099 RepID=UPI001B17D083|nr:MULTISPECIES: M48 family metalloprotease [unclassified Roseofilum]MBP0012155.1 M48 family metalloprotease [Roseofilum sp. SID3]MBP0022380.1 M48 family metalloprotease [Roseofilum sp. SID2]MBP0039920.1 M48 family metalloprotease [Roseofilum sp. SID1]MBP0041748.1 M48 family metalloprotease [Roseofilum sp. SBFL]
MSSPPPQRPSLTAGLAALKRQEYDLAIAHLNGVYTNESEGICKRRAQQGLVIAYRKVGQGQQALNLCQLLIYSPDAPFQNWAKKTLPKLKRQFPDLEPSKTMSPDDPTDALPVSAPQAPKTEVKEPNNRLSVPSTAPEVRTWKNAGRAKRWGTLPKTSKLGSDIRWLWGLQGITAIAFFGWMVTVIEISFSLVQYLLLKLPFLSPWQILYQDPTLFLFIFSLLIFIASPVLLSVLLKKGYELEPLNLEHLKTIRPESATLIQRCCRQRKLPQPTLGILPTSLPLIFTYIQYPIGHLRPTGHVVISQGMLDRLEDDELAIFYATQLAHILNWDFLLLSACVCFLQLPYTLYWSVSKLGERLADRLDIPLLELIVRGLSTLLANLSYTYYHLFRLPLLLLSRWRLLYSDASAVSLTGDPNALTRGLLKLAQSWHRGIMQTSTVPEVVERFDLLLPLGVEQAIAIGNLTPNQPFESVLQWDLHNLYRYGVTLLSSHGRLGDRLQRLTDLARFFRLETELDLPFIPPRRFSLSSDFTQWLTTQMNFSLETELRLPFSSPIRLSLPSTLPEWLKTAINLIVATSIFVNNSLPLFPRSLCQAFIVGIGFRLVLMLVGAIAYFFYVGQLVWLSQDQDGDLITACYFISLSLILMLQINRYYPEVRPLQAQRIDRSESFAKFQIDATLTPQKRQIMRLQGKLLGRRGVHNGLGQTLMLHTSAGLIRLRHCPRASIFGDWGINPICPKDLIGQSVKVGGWLHRGADVAIDLAYLEGRSQLQANSYHPLLLSLLAISFGLWGAYLVFQT